MGKKFTHVLTELKKKWLTNGWTKRFKYVTQRNRGCAMRSNHIFLYRKRNGFLRTISGRYAGF